LGIPPAVLPAGALGGTTGLTEGAVLAGAGDGFAGSLVWSPQAGIIPTSNAAAIWSERVIFQRQLYILSAPPPWTGRLN
jgi:hypothetical protein